MRYFIDRVETTKEEFDMAFATNFYDFKVIGKEKVNLTFNQETKDNYLREKRKPLLNEGFDKWEKAVLRRREADDPIIMAWYQDLKDLKESAFENIPERIKYYLGGSMNE